MRLTSPTLLRMPGGIIHSCLPQTQVWLGWWLCRFLLMRDWRLRKQIRAASGQARTETWWAVQIPPRPPEDSDAKNSTRNTGIVGVSSRTAQWTSTSPGR